MKCLKPITLPRRSPGQILSMTVPCGKCLQCRIQKRKEWQLRMLHELDDWETASFVTLTYNDYYLPFPEPYMISGKGEKTQYSKPIGPITPYWPTLKKNHLQKFLKRLRKNYDTKIKYFACGEYGENNQRPHYHLILYGLGLSGDARTHVMACWPFCDWQNPAIAQGSFGLVEPESVGYVAGYIDKKYSGEIGLLAYESLGREPPFRLGSQGLGKNYIDKNIQQMLDNGYVTLRGKKRSIPRYYIKKLEENGYTLDTKDNQEEQQKERNYAIIGLNHSDSEIRKMQRPDISATIDQAMQKVSEQREKNLAAKISQKKSKF